MIRGFRFSGASPPHPVPYGERRTCSRERYSALLYSPDRMTVVYVIGVSTDVQCSISNYTVPLLCLCDIAICSLELAQRSRHLEGSHNTSSLCLNHDDNLDAFHVCCCCCSSLHNTVQRIAGTVRILYAHSSHLLLYISPSFCKS